MIMDQDLRLSVSKVKCYDSCAKKFQYNYILKMPRKEFEFYAFGKLLHKALEEFHLAYLNGSTAPHNKTMSAAFKVARAEYKDKITPEMLDECIQILGQYLKVLALKTHKLSMPVTAIEKNFELSITDKIMLVGAIDRTQIDDDNILHIADYKTTKNKKYLKDDPFQLMTYAMVMMMNDPSIQQIRASYILLRHNFEFITWPFHREDIMAIKDKYIEYASQIMNEKEYVANPSKMCKYCDFIDICSEGQKATHAANFNGEVAW